MRRTLGRRWAINFLALSAAVACVGSAPLLAADDGPAEAKPNPELIRPIGPELIKPVGPATQPANPASQPTTKPADPHADHKKSEKKTVEVDAETRQLLDKVRDAYKAVKTLKVAGTIAGDFDLNGQKEKHQANFVASLFSPTEFRHELTEVSAGGAAAKESALIGGNGKKLYVYEPKYKYFYLQDLPKERTGDAMGKTVNSMLSQQNPSLLLTLVADASVEILDGVDKVEQLDEVKIGDVECHVIRLAVGKEFVVTLFFDPKTSLLRRCEQDFRGYAEAKKQKDVNKAMVTVDYASTETGVELAAAGFAWTPPVGARDMTAVADAGGGDVDDGAPDAAHADLIGKPAPDFKLKGLDGQDVKLSDLKGQVVLLDFWATWCGPCRASLPHLDEIYQERKEKGLKAYAVDLRESEAEVQGFVEKTKLGIPVLMDKDGKVAKSFGVSGIPQTVVIDKEGKIKKIVVGSGTHDQVKAAIDEAMK